MLTEIYNFFLSWLWGDTVPEALQPIQSEVTIVLCLFLGALVIFSAWWVVKTVFFCIFNAWR